MAKTIWIINDYAGSPYHGMEFRNFYFAKEWVKKGFNVYIITASYMHLFKTFPKIKGNFTFEKIDGINYLWIKVPKYGESTNKKRVLKWFIFTLKLFFLPVKKMKKPDVVIASPMAPFLVIPAYKIAKKYNAKFIFEVKDIWPLSIIELGNINPNHPLIKMMSWCEKFAIKTADIIVSSLQNYQEHLKKDLNIDKDFVWINNGIDIEEMEKIEALPDNIKNKIPKNKFIIGYTGTIGIANALDSFLKAAEILKDNKDILFVIVGDGKEKSKLLKKYGKLDNVLFIEPIKKQQVQSMLSLFDVCYICLLYTSPSPRD
jgi:glycosyltransferase involved in cell wall biosynthesis